MKACGGAAIASHSSERLSRQPPQMTQGYIVIPHFLAETLL
jgi:hypothetical protein